MAQDSKISDLNTAAALSGTEFMPVVQSGETRKVTVSNLLAAASSAWGLITGTPSAQTDLQLGTIQGSFIPNNSPIAANDTFKTSFQKTQGQIQSLSNIFPATALNGLQVWHSMINTTGNDGDTISTFPDLSINANNGVVTGGFRKLKIEADCNIKGINLQSVDDVITFSCNFTIRTIAVLLNNTRTFSAWQDYYGILSEPTGASNFSITCDASYGYANSGVSGRDFYTVGADNYYFNSIQVNKIKNSDFIGDGGNPIHPEFAPFANYKLVIFELKGDVNSVPNLQWGQERSSGAGRAWEGVICDGLIWNRVLTQIEKDDLANYFINNRKIDNNLPTNYNLVIDGNSYAAGAITSGGQSLAYQVKQLLGSDWQTTTFGVGSAQTPDMNKRFYNIVSTYFKKGYVKNIYFPMEISNHLSFNAGVNATQAFNAYAAICDIARKRGFTIIGNTLFDRQDTYANAKANYQTDRAAINVSIRNYHNLKNELVVDFAIDSRLSDATNRTYFNPDQVHPNDAGTGVMASLLYNTLSLTQHTPSLPTVTTVTTSSTLTYTGVLEQVVLGNTSGGIFTTTMPSASGYAGYKFILKKIGTGVNVWTIATTSSQTIDGNSTATISTSNVSITIISDGNNWQIIQ